MNTLIRIKISFIIGCFLLFPVSIQSSGIKFHHLSVDDGLSQGSIYAIVQDHYGLLWFATKDGLNKYDGYNFTVYRNDPLDSTSLPANFVSALDIDSEGNIWVGTNGGGLAKFLVEEDKFERINLTGISQGDVDFSSISDIHISSNGKVWFSVRRLGVCMYDPDKNVLKQYDDLDSGSSPNDYNILPVFEDSRNNIWFSSLYNGVIKLNPATGEFVHYRYDPSDKTGVCNEVVTSIEEDAGGNIWIATNEGLNKYDYSTGKFSIIPLIIRKLSDTYPLDRLRDIKCDNKGNLWLVTLGAGLLKLDLQNFELEAFTVSPDDEFSISNNTLETLFVDNTGSLWIGTNGMGVDIYFPFSKNFHTIGKNVLNSSTSGFGSLRSIFVNSDRTIWIGGYNGIIKYDKAGGIFDILPDRIKNNHEAVSTYLINKAVYSLLPDPQNPERVLWIGTEGSGLIRYDDKSKTFLNFYFFNNGNNYPELGRRIYKIIESLDGNLFLGTSRGFVKFNIDDFSYKIYKHDPKDRSSIVDGKIKTIVIDSRNNIWVGSDLGGFALFNPEDESFTRYTATDDNEVSLSSNIVNQILEDSKGRYWIGTGRGLKRFYYPENKFNTYSTKDGLANNVIYGILEDRKGTLWLSTNNGLSNFDPERETFLNYTKSDGLQGNEFNGGAFYKDEEGILYFGGTKGLTYFDPDEIKENPFPPEVVITSVSIIGDTIRTFSHIPNLGELKLSYGERIIQFSAAALNYQNPENNSYAYKLEGFKKDWIYTGNRRDITFTSLDPGEYTLNIIASNNDGLWNRKGIKLSLLVTPPFWREGWFLFVVLIIGITGVYLFIRFKLRQSRVQKEQLEKIVEERTSELEKNRQELEDANRAKDKFFSIIAHDMKNPFNSLLGFSELLVRDFEELSDAEKKEYVEGIADASKSAYNLLENLLDWSRIQMDRVEIVKEVLKLNELIDYNVKVVAMSARNKDITIIKSYKGEYNIYADKYTIDTVIRNLLTNAIKFTPVGGKVEIKTKELQDDIMISIIDNGIGIAEDMKASLFHVRNTQVSFGTGGEKGTGLGLILCKEFIEANSGKIFVESREGAGSKFLITVPKEK